MMGLHGAMHDSLSRSKTWLPRFDRGWCYPVMSGVTIGAVLPWAAVFGTGKMTRASIALPTVAGVIVLSLAVLAFLTRELELLAPDERPRIRRFRALAWGFAIAVVAGIVTAVIVALVHR